MITYPTTYSDYITQTIIPALAEFAADYDTYAIASEMLEWREIYTDASAIDLNCTGYYERDDIDFWEVAARHELTTEVAA